MFMCTLQGQYYEKMLGSISSRFSDLVIVREHIENGIKTGKIQSISSDSTSESLRYFQVGEENETSAIWESYQYPETPSPVPYHQYSCAVDAQCQQPSSGLQHQHP